MKGSNETKPKKPIYKKWWPWVIAILVIGGIGGALDEGKEAAAPESTAPAAPAVTTEVDTPAIEEPAVKPAEEPFAEPSIEPAIAGDWRAEIEKIASSDGSPTEKADAIEAVAMDYAPSDSEIKEFEAYIISEFVSGNYLTGLTDDRYSLTNIFQALTFQ